jgi:hypothetical protein
LKKKKKRLYRNAEQDWWEIRFKRFFLPPPDRAPQLGSCERRCRQPTEKGNAKTHADYDSRWVGRGDPGSDFRPSQPVEGAGLDLRKDPIEFAQRPLVFSKAELLAWNVLRRRAVLGAARAGASLTVGFGVPWLVAVGIGQFCVDVVDQGSNGGSLAGGRRDIGRMSRYWLGVFGIVCNLRVARLARVCS